MWWALLSVAAVSRAGMRWSRARKTHLSPAELMTDLASTAVRAPSPPLPSSVTVCTIHPSSLPSPRLPPPVGSARSIRTTRVPRTSSPVSLSVISAAAEGGEGRQVSEAGEGRKRVDWWKRTLLEVLHELVRRHDARLWAQERPDDPLAHVRLEPPHGIAVEPLERHVADAGLAQTLDLVVQAAEVADLVLARRENELARVLEADTVVLAARVEEVATTDAEGRLERVGRVIQPAVNDLGVARRRLLADLAVAARSGAE